MPHDVAERAAGALTALLAGACDSIVVAGSIRRRQATVGDVEIVAVPIVREWLQAGLFDDGVPHTSVNLLDRRLDDLLADGAIERRPRRDGKLVWGPYGKCFSYRAPGVPAPVPVDLYTPEPERAGWIVLLRTGPAAFSRQLVIERPSDSNTDPRRTSDGRLGLRPAHIRSIDGWLCTSDGRRIETPTERSAFDALELAWIEPTERT